jgi:hypothetical protein
MERAEGINRVFLQPVAGGSTWKVDLESGRKGLKTNKEANFLNGSRLSKSTRWSVSDSG